MSGSVRENTNKIPFVLTDFYKFNVIGEKLPSEDILFRQHQKEAFDYSFH